MGLRKSVSPCFTLLLPFISHLSSYSLMHLFIRRGLLYSFEHIFFHAQQPDLCFSTLHCYIAPSRPVCVSVCVLVSAYTDLLPSAFQLQKKKRKKKLKPKSNYSSKILCFWPMQFHYYKCDLFIYLSIYSFVYIALKKGKLVKPYLWGELGEDNSSEQIMYLIPRLIPSQPVGFHNKSKNIFWGRILYIIKILSLSSL